MIRISRQSTNRSFCIPTTGFERIGERTINKPVIIPRAQHIISRELISENALKVLYRLKDAGYASLLVGGCVRDLMLGREPKDFDVVTDARPEEIRKLFHGARVIGRRFRLVHVRFGWQIIEVATFRAIPRDIAEESIPGDDEEKEHAEDSRSPKTEDHNIFGSQEEDAVRRDFTVNALYYDISDFSVLDYVGGVSDLKAGILRVIGDPATRYREDPVRMLRAIRFAAKLGFKLEEQSAAPIRDLAPLLTAVPPARTFEEVLKLFHGGHALKTYELLRHYGLFQYLFPLTEKSLEIEVQGFPVTLVPRALTNTDSRVNDDKPVTPAFLFATILWEPVRRLAGEFKARGMHSNDAMFRAAEDVLKEQLRYVSIPKRFSVPMREIWSLQSRFDRRAGMQAFRLLENKRFRAAYDFLLLRTESGESDRALADWWTRFQAVGEDERRDMVANVAPSTDPSKRRHRRRRAPSSQATKA
ncbi:MAG: polynucleotide adenylyltransferase PcnB [Sulfuricaulis sp.]